MAHNPEMRASDADREHMAAALREHHAAGRLDLDEFYNRLDATYQAKTLGDLDEIVADLPEQDLYELPVPADKHATTLPPQERGALSRFGRAAWQGVWGTWFVVSFVNFVIWLLLQLTSVHPIYPWWLWVAGPWGAVLLAGQVLGAPNPVESRRTRELRRNARERRRVERRARQAERRRELRQRHR